MARVRNWLPPMSREEMAWFDACPKAVLFEIARQFAERLVDESNATAFDVITNEWRCLYQNGLVPQKPFERPL